MNLILTCEHAGNEIPEAFKELFTEAGEVLETHRGYDPGALDLFNELSRLSDFGQQYMISRLLVEPNRSSNHPQLFSEFTRNLHQDEKEDILQDFYLPYRNYIESKIRNLIAGGKDVLHLSVHSFTPELNGEVRSADLGLLFDPAREMEVEFCEQLKKQLLQQNKDLVIRFNYPYLGIDDGFTTHLREIFPQHYAGIELEVNQKYVQENQMEKGLKNDIFEAISKMNF